MEVLDGRLRGMHLSPWTMLSMPGGHQAVSRMPGTALAKSKLMSDSIQSRARIVQFDRFVGDQGAVGALLEMAEPGPFLNQLEPW
jgi:hypothetical protein